MNRVCWHEFGHALLYESVASPNFGFAHSAGDSMAAIFNDPGSNAPDRGLTFPWVDAGSGFDRRHDRDVTAGWAWFGTQYDTQYLGEQVLSTTLFRLYRSYGGDSPWLSRQRAASDYVMNLIFGGCGAMTSTTQFPDVFEGALEDFEKNIPSFQGVPGGHLHKVIRWAFEKQGLFQPAAVPGAGNTVMSEGNPPNVDVYIDDGRGGEYGWLGNHWSCQDMWVRNMADGGLTHQQPLVGLTNYMYVRVKNRGTQTASNVSVDAYHCMPGTGLAFPDDWMPMTTTTLPASGPIPSGGETIVGPFAFVPTQVGHECLLAIAHADDDPGNDTTINGTIAENRLVPYDNNIGQRNVNPIYPSLIDLVEWWEDQLIWIRNPWRDWAVCYIDVRMPRFLQKLGWQIHLVSEGGRKFEMEPRGRREIRFKIEPGKELDQALVRRALAEGDNEIRIETYLNGEISGGMSYPLSFEARRGGDRKLDPDQDGGGSGPIVAGNTIRDILDILRVRLGGGTTVAQAATESPAVKRIRLEFDLDDEA